jgi:DNA-binding transcriptional ArsR family regulator
MAIAHRANATCPAEAAAATRHLPASRVCGGAGDRGATQRSDGRQPTRAWLETFSIAFSARSASVSRRRRLATTNHNSSSGRLRPSRRRRRAAPANGARRAAVPGHRSTPKAAVGRARRGANREAILAAVGERPGATAREIADLTGVARNTVASTLTRLAAAGVLERSELPAGGVGFRLARGASAD